MYIDFGEDSCEMKHKSMADKIYWLLIKLLKEEISMFLVYVSNKWDFRFEGVSTILTIKKSFLLNKYTILNPLNREADKQLNSVDNI